MNVRRSGMPLLLLFAALPGCGGDDAAARDAERAIRSWSATVSMAGEQWVRREVPGPYLRQVTEAADEALRKQESDLSELSERGSRSGSSPSPDRLREVQGHLRDLRQRLGEVRRALENEDRTAMFDAVARMPRQADEGS